MTRPGILRRTVWALPLGVVVLLTVSGTFAAPVRAEVDVCDGVSLAIDDGDTVTTTCVDLAQGSGFAVLNAADVDYTFVPGVPGFVCTINDSPRPCNNAPVHAYWSYWQADADGPWVCASQGAATSEVVAPAIEGWAFGTGDAPPRVAGNRAVASTCRGGSTAAADVTGAPPEVAVSRAPTLALGILVATAASLVAVGLRRRRPIDRNKDGA